MSEIASTYISEKTQIRLSVRKLIALLCGAVTLTAGAVAYHLKTLNDIESSINRLAESVGTIRAEIKQDEMAQRKATWSVIDQSRWATKLDHDNQPVERIDKTNGLIVPDPLEIHPLTAGAASLSSMP